PDLPRDRSHPLLSHAPRRQGEPLQAARAVLPLEPEGARRARRLARRRARRPPRPRRRRWPHRRHPALQPAHAEPAPRRDRALEPAPARRAPRESEEALVPDDAADAQPALSGAHMIEKLWARLVAPQPLVRLELIRILAPLAVLCFLSSRIAHV